MSTNYFLIFAKRRKILSIIMNAKQLYKIKKDIVNDMNSDNNDNDSDSNGKCGNT